MTRWVVRPVKDAEQVIRDLETEGRPFAGRSIRLAVDGGFRGLWFVVERAVERPSDPGTWDVYVSRKE